ncbi:MAG: hypothetical protein AB1801_14920 [Chloroflexota bacterium]
MFSSPLISWRAVADGAAIPRLQGGDRFVHSSAPPPRRERDERQVRAEGQVDWMPWLTETSEPQAKFVGLPGQVYTSLAEVQAVDNINNPGEWVQAGPVAIASVTRYYHHGDQRARPEQGRRVAMRQGDAVYYLHGDHLGSVSLTTDSQGTVVSEGRYLPYGEACPELVEGSDGRPARRRRTSAPCSHPTPPGFRPTGSFWISDFGLKPGRRIYSAWAKSRGWN